MRFNEKEGKYYNEDEFLKTKDQKKEKKLKKFKKLEKEEKTKKQKEQENELLYYPN